jgi:hypothetical protein
VTVIHPELRLNQPRAHPDEVPVTRRQSTRVRQARERRREAELGAVRLPEDVIRILGPEISIGPDHHQAFGQNPDGTPNNPQTFPWASLNNQRIILSFIPATQADQDALNALIPVGATDGSQIPASIPGYLINVIPQLEVNGTVVMTGSAMTLGSDLTFVFDPQFVTAGTEAFSYDLPAGSYVDIAVIAGSVNQAQITANSTSLANTAAIIQSNQAAQTAALTREQLLGDLFQSGILSYFAQYAAGAYLAGLGQGGHHSLAAGLGSLGYEVNVDMTFGIPRSVSSGGIVLNIPIVSAVRQDSEDPSLTRSYTTQIGIMSSALESAVPEQLFAATGGTAISAVEALSLANSAGQDIYQITQDNEATVLPLIHQSSAALTEMQNALASGHTVIAHTDPVSVTGWTGCGYVILDPATGTGAYKISGGANGSWLKWVDDHAVLLALVGIGLAFIEGPVFLLLGALLTAITAIAGLYVFYEESLELGNCEVLFYLYAALVIGLSLVALIPGAGAGFIVALGVIGLIGPTAVTTVAKSPACKNQGPPPDVSE